MTIFSRKREPEQRELSHFDEQVREYDKEMAEDIFDRKKRLSNLGEGKFAVRSDTIFSAILQELKNRSARN